MLYLASGVLLVGSSENQLEGFGEEYLLRAFPCLRQIRSSEISEAFASI